MPNNRRFLRFSVNKARKSIRLFCLIFWTCSFFYLVTPINVHYHYPHLFFQGSYPHTITNATALLLELLWRFGTSGYYLHLLMKRAEHTRPVSKAEKLNTNKLVIKTVKRMYHRKYAMHEFIKVNVNLAYTVKKSILLKNCFQLYKKVVHLYKL